MSNKTSNIYICKNCDAQFLKWSGRCLECGAWGTLSEESVDWKKEKDNFSEMALPAEVIDLDKIKINDEINRLKTGFSEADRVFGGGIVAGSLTLLSGDPGAGKSTILAQIADAVGKNIKSNNDKVIYVSGEESASQIKSRLKRLNCDLNGIKFISETNTEKIASAIKKKKPFLVIIDSIQTVYSSSVVSESGNISQIRACTVSFLEVAKQNNVAIILVGHITKDGQVAGPKSLEHIVDTVIHLESDNRHNYRLLRSTKNRFGSVNELGIFEMTSRGFIEVKNPSGVFLEGNQKNTPGSVISCIMEGTRPFLIEIQALVSKTVFGYPQRKTSGYDSNRLQVLTTVLTKRAGANLANQDIILNVVGGMKVYDPALDLAVCFAIISSLLNQVVDKKTLVLGEVGLGGEIRNISRLKERILEAEKLGLNKVITQLGGLKFEKIETINIDELKEIVSFLKK